MFSHAAFRPAAAADAAEIREGLAGSLVVLRALEAVVEGRWLVGDRLSLADLHLGPMMAYFVAARDGAAMLADFPRLTGWWGHMRGRGSMVASDPGLPLRGEGR